MIIHSKISVTKNVKMPRPCNGIFFLVPWLSNKTNTKDDTYSYIIIIIIYIERSNIILLLYILYANKDTLLHTTPKILPSKSTTSILLDIIIMATRNAGAKQYSILRQHLHRAQPQHEKTKKDTAPNLDAKKKGTTRRTRRTRRTTRTTTTAARTTTTTTRLS